LPEEKAALNLEYCRICGKKPDENRDFIMTPEGMICRPCFEKTIEKEVNG